MAELIKEDPYAGNIKEGLNSVLFNLSMRKVLPLNRPLLLQCSFICLSFSNIYMSTRMCQKEDPSFGKIKEGQKECPFTGNIKFNQ